MYKGESQRKPSTAADRGLEHSRGDGTTGDMISTASFLDRYDKETEEGRRMSQDDFQPSGYDDNTADDDDTADDDKSWPNAPLNQPELVDTIRGYESVSFEARNVPPPATPPPPSAPEGDEDAAKAEADVPPPVPPPPPIVLESDCKITEEEAKEALLAFLSDHCCYGKSAAHHMVIKKMEHTAAFHYELQTFSEKRETAWTYAPVKSSTGLTEAFSCVGGAAPLPWEIEEYPTQPFRDEVRLVAVPNTSSVKSCHRCRGTGGVVCRDCNGKGWSRCIHCHGDGWLGDMSGGMRERCFYCHHSKHGHGQQDCQKCNTKGKVNCAMCEGQGQIRCYIQLSITWKVHTAEHIVEKLELPKEFIRDVSGQVAFEEEVHRIKPLENVADKDIKEASARLISNHANTFSDQKIICQRHQVRVVPMTKITYEWKGRMHNFFVYGYENRAYVKKYPQQCCWGCAIL